MCKKVKLDADSLRLVYLLVAIHPQLFEKMGYSGDIGINLGSIFSKLLSRLELFEFHPRQTKCTSILALLLLAAKSQLDKKTYYLGLTEKLIEVWIGNRQGKSLSMNICIIYLSIINYQLSIIEHITTA